MALVASPVTSNVVARLITFTSSTVHYLPQTVTPLYYGSFDNTRLFVSLDTIASPLKFKFVNFLFSFVVFGDGDLCPFVTWTPAANEHICACRSAVHIISLKFD